MGVVHYPAVVERAGAGYSLFFPDLPGCTSAGATLQEAALGAEEALSGHLAVSAEHGDEVPAPSALDAIERDPDVDEVGRILVRGEQPGKAVRVQISMDEGLLARIDRVADNRSGFLADAAKLALMQHVAALSISPHESERDAELKVRAAESYPGRIAEDAEAIAVAAGLATPKRTRKRKQAA